MSEETILVLAVSLSAIILAGLLILDSGPRRPTDDPADNTPFGDWKD